MPRCVFAIYRLTHGPEGPEGLLEALRSASAPFVEKGYRSSRVLREADESGGLLLMEEWETQADLERHIRSSSFRRVLSVLELSRTPPEVVYVGSEWLRGMEWIAEIRGARGDGTSVSPTPWRR